MLAGPFATKDLSFLVISNKGRLMGPRDSESSEGANDTSKNHVDSSLCRWLLSLWNAFHGPFLPFFFMRVCVLIGFGSVNPHF